MDIKLPIIIILALLFFPVYFVFAQTPAICGELEYSTLREGSFSCEKVEADLNAVDNIDRINDLACPLGVREVEIVNKELVPKCNNVSQLCDDSEYYGGFNEGEVQCISISLKSHYGRTCARNQILRGINEDSSLDCMDISIDISCPEGQYLTGIKTHNGLYMIGSSGFLYELDTTGRRPARRIGGSFSGLEKTPVSITSHNGKLYMIGSSSDFLYELDTTGKRPARRIGRIFRDQENDPRSITSHKGKLYMIGGRRDTLYELDTTGSRRPARRIGISFGDQEDDPRSITSHNGKLYMIGQHVTSLYELDTTGRRPARRIGGSFGGANNQQSITSHKGELYTIGSFSDLLYKFDTEATGSPATGIGRSFRDQEDDPRSIASHNERLYMIGDSSDSLYELDTTGSRPARKIGESFDGESDPISIASHSRTEASCQTFPSE